MPLVDAKCTNCGSPLKVDNSQEAAVCEFCGSAYIVEKAINNYNITNNVNVGTGATVNVYETTDDFLIEAGTLKKYQGKSTDVVIPNEVKIIDEYAFDKLKGLNSIFIPKSVNSISIWAINHCDNLSSLQVEPGNPTYDSRNNCNAIIETKSNKLVVGCINTIIPDDVTEIAQDAFSGCLIEEIVIPNSVVHIGAYAFNWCNKLKTVVLNNGLRSISSSAFSNCTSLERVTMPNSLEIICDSAFSGCSSLTEVILSDNTKKIGSSAFANCKRLEKIHIPDSIESIGYGAFGGTSIESVTIPKNTTITTNSYGESSLGYNIKVNHSNNGCYIATAVYGSYDCPQVWTLRRYRDNELAKTWYGRAFIHTYYTLSPTLVKWFGHTDWFKKMWRGKLDRMVQNLNSNGVENTPYNDIEW